MHQSMFQRRVWIHLKDKRKSPQSFVFSDDVERTNEEIIETIKVYCLAAGAPAERVLVLEE